MQSSGHVWVLIFIIKALVLIISQSGLSADLVECENKSKQMGATTILISNNYKSPMVDTSNIFFSPQEFITAKQKETKLSKKSQYEKNKK